MNFSIIWGKGASMTSIKSVFNRIRESIAYNTGTVLKKGPADTEISKRLNRLAVEVRLATLESIYKAGSGHGGTSLSIVDIITALLFHRLNWSKFLEEVRGKTHEEQWSY